MTQDHLSHLRWIAFDLDDTLHYFKRASGRAAEVIFRDVERQFGIGLDQLSEAYREILRAAQSSHFSQPKTSREYRAERFGALLSRFECDPGPQMDRLLDIYDATLREALELKPGARQALIAAKRANLSVMVVSEGPHDAQSATIERLDIASYIDLLVTYVGDSLARDIVPTSALGIANVYVGEDALPDGLAAMRLDLVELSRRLDRLAGASDLADNL